MDYFSGWCKSKRRLDGLTAIVTGCNTGIGKETVRDFYLRGARVIMACRDLKKAEDAKKDIEQTVSDQKKGEQTASDHQKEEQTASDQRKEEQTSSDKKKGEQTASDQQKEEQTASDQKKGEQTSSDQKKGEQTSSDQQKREQTASDEQKGTVVLERLDVSSFKSVREFAYKILEQEPRIDILVNNAGVMCCPAGKTEDGFETHMGTNHMGHALLTLLLLPRLTKSAPSRIVFVSSILHSSAILDFEDMNFEKSRYDPLKAYNRSKAANVLYVKALARKLKERNITDVTTYSLHPGIIQTDIGRHFSDTLWYGARWAFNNIVSIFSKSPRCGAQTSIYCAIDESCAQQSGWYYSPPKHPSKHCRDNAVADKLWDYTLEHLKLKNYDPFGGEDPKRSLFDN